MSTVPVCMAAVAPKAQVRGSSAMVLPTRDRITAPTAPQTKTSTSSQMGSRS